MLKLTSVLLILIGTCAAQNDNPINQLQGTARILMVFSPDANGANFKRQLELIEHHNYELTERNTVVVPRRTGNRRQRTPLPRRESSPRHVHGTGRCPVPLPRRARPVPRSPAQSRWHGAGPLRRTRWHPRSGRQPRRHAQALAQSFTHVERAITAYRRFTSEETPLQSIHRVSVSGNLLSQ